MNASGGAPRPRSTGDTPGSGLAVADERGSGAAGLSVSRASLEEWHQVVGWAADEGWNPGDGDVDHFHPVDPSGFFLGRVEGRPVSAVSVVNHSPEYAFLGYYLVHPDLRGSGLGLATWRAAFPHAGGRTVGLDAVPAQEPTYRRSGFTAAYRNLHFTGVPERRAAVPEGVVPVTQRFLPAIAAYDRRCFPADRGAFLGGWLTGPGRSGYALLRDGEVAGFGLIRPARDGLRIGPLFAEDAPGAGALLDALTAGLGPDDEVHLDVPEHHEAACALVAERGLRSASHTVRMYHGEVPASRAAAVWAATSLELG